MEMVSSVQLQSPPQLPALSIPPDSNHVRRPCLPYGVKACQGKRSVMEDKYAIVAELCCTPVSSPQCECADVPLRFSPRGSSLSPALQDSPLEELTFFGVYDGHGGAEVAEHCARRLHENLKTYCNGCVTRDGWSACVDATGVSPARTSGELNISEFKAVWNSKSWQTREKPRQSPSPASSMSISLETDELAQRSFSRRPEVSQMCDALRKAFIKTDSELKDTDVGELVGSTALCALIGHREMYLGHCGDSRAVLCRSGVAFNVTADHKPDRRDEMARIEASGGRIIYKAGGCRVMGLLAMSRAIGDHFLRPYVVSEPEVIVIDRALEDELLILATDGLWDVFTNQEAANLALRCLERSCSRGASRNAACRVAANVLTRAAIERGSKDNVTVVLVDLRPDGVLSRASSVLKTHGSEQRPTPPEIAKDIRRCVSSSERTPAPFLFSDCPREHWHSCTDQDLQRIWQGVPSPLFASQCSLKVNPVKEADEDWLEKMDEMKATQPPAANIPPLPPMPKQNGRCQWKGGRWGHLQAQQGRCTG